MGRCDICVDPACEEKGGGGCHCDTCALATKCHRVLHPTIRITMKCTQTCGHCCFACSPKTEKHMAIDTAKATHQFLVANGIDRLNIMGGEFFLNPQWEQILTVLVKDMKMVRVVTNGDWAASKKETLKVVNFFSNQKHIVLSLSCDQWHTNRYVEKAAAFCREANIPHNVATSEQVTRSSIVPVGRGTYEAEGLYNTFGCYCRKPENKYSFLIDEEGDIFKCVFGVLRYSDVYKHVNGGFAEVFREFGRKFYGIFIPNCASCVRSLYGHCVKENWYDE